MKESMIQEALALFEQRGDSAVEEINAIMKQNIAKLINFPPWWRGMAIRQKKSSYAKKNA